MDLQTAQFTLMGLAGVLLVVWVTAGYFTLNSMRRSNVADEPVGEFAVPVGPDQKLVAARVETEGAADELSRKAARLLAQGKFGLAARIVEHRSDGVRFELTAPPGGFAPVIRSGEARYRSIDANRSEAECFLVLDRPGPLMLWLAVGSLAVGLAAIVAGYVLVDWLVVHTPDPAIRLQVFQMLQAVHFVWPPFLFAGLYRGQARMRVYAARRLLDGLTHNLPYVD